MSSLLVTKVTTHHCVYVEASILTRPVPHPLFASFELRISTTGTVTPKQALVNCITFLVNSYGKLGQEFNKEYELRKMVTGDGLANDEIMG